MAAALNLIAVAALSLLIVSASAAYTNHTVGGDSGWFFNATTNTSTANFSSWAATQTFNLGDYLIFATNTNQTVIQTFNLTTYAACNADDASDNDTFEYNGGNVAFGQPLSIPVALTKEGVNYFFSDADDGVQCVNGMRFQIDVKHGDGLPAYLNQPPPPPYVSPPGTDSQSPPTTVTAVPNGGARAGGSMGKVENAPPLMIMILVLLL